MRKVLVTGATGFIGRHFCRRLKRQGLYIRVLSRQPAQQGDWDACYVGDLQTSLPDNLLEEIDSVFHLAGYAHAMSDNDALIHQQTSVLGTQKLLQAVERSQVKRIVYLSSVKAMGPTGDACVDETYKLPPQDAYGRAKLEAENLLLEFGQQQNIHTCVLRPTLVYGAGVKGNLQRMVNAIRRGRFPPVNISDNKRSMVSVDDLITAMLLAADNTQANGQVYIVSDGQDYSTRDIYDIIHQQLARPLPRWSLSRDWLMRLATLGELLYKYLRIKIPINKEVLQRLSGSACFSSLKLQNELGWRPQYSLQDVDITKTE